MGIINSGCESFFTEESYQTFLQKRNSYHNERIRSDDETIFDALLSEEADFTKSLDGEIIIKTIKDFY